MAERFDMGARHSELIYSAHGIDGDAQVRHSLFPQRQELFAAGLRSATMRPSTLEGKMLRGGWWRSQGEHRSDTFGPQHIFRPLSEEMPVGKINMQSDQFWVQLLPWIAFLLLAPLVTYVVSESTPKTIICALIAVMVIIVWDLEWKTDQPSGPRTWHSPTPAPSKTSPERVTSPSSTVLPSSTGGINPAPTPTLQSYQAVTIHLPTGAKVECEVIVSPSFDHTSWDEITLSFRDYVHPDINSAPPPCILKLLSLTKPPEPSSSAPCQASLITLNYEILRTDNIHHQNIFRSVLGNGGCYGADELQADMAAVQDAVGKLRKLLDIY